MKKLITANDIREAHARGEQAMSVVLRASIITPEAREVADLLGFTITECDESIPVTASEPTSRTEVLSSIIFIYSATATFFRCSKSISYC